MGEEFILFAAAAGVSTVLRHLRGERERSALDEALNRNAPPASDAVRMVALLFTARYPKGLYDFVIGIDRWVLRVQAYVSLMCDEYPPFRLDMGPREPESLAAPKSA